MDLLSQLGDLYLLGEREVNLSYKHIDYVCALLRKQFPEVKGLCSTFKNGVKADFDTQIDRNYRTVQIHHLSVDNKEYWATSGSNPDEPYIYVYDSILVGNPEKEVSLPLDLEVQLSQIYQSLGVLTIMVPKVPFRATRANSGLFAIGCALELCLGNDPSESRFNERKLRDHVANCFRDGHLKPFPQTKLRSKPFKHTFVVPLICDCRMPAQYDHRLIGCYKCRAWYHDKCYENYNKEHWICKSCEKEGPAMMGDGADEKPLMNLPVLLNP